MLKRGSIFLVLLIVLTACAQPTEEAPTLEETVDVTLMLDWVPNVNHTGIFVAQENGYFEEAGLDVEIVQPGEVFAEQAVATGSVDFGISFQEYVTIARAGESPLVSIAAIIQENTSGFTSRGDVPLETPADFAGLTYGSFGSPFEEPTLASLMNCTGADPDAVEIVDVGFADPLILLQEEQIDLAWIFFGTQGIAAEQQGIDINIVMMNDYFDCIPNYYTPILITNETMIAEQPEVVEAFTQAVARGYSFAIEAPEESARILAEETPETDVELLIASQEWLSPRYQGDASQWGIQEATVWQEYTQWMVDNGVIEAMIDIPAAYTNDYLP